MLVLLSSVELSWLTHYLVVFSCKLDRLRARNHYGNRSYSCSIVTIMHVNGLGPAFDTIRSVDPAVLDIFKGTSI